MPRLIALLCLLGLLAAIPATASAAPVAKKKATACSKAKTVKAKRKYCIATKKCLKAKSKKARARYCKPKRKRKPVVKRPAPKPVTPPVAVTPPGAPRVEGGPDDAVVIAVLDSGFNPYHWDFDATRMPQNSDATPANDLPLDRSPETWLPGFDGTSFKTFAPLQLTLDRKDPDTQSADLLKADEKKWEAVKASTATERHAVWFPGTKVIGGMTYGAAGSLDGTPGSHGTGTTSSVVGNLHGTCPECLLFFINYGSDPEGAINWAMQQPWIDGISNSYGLGSNPVYGRDRIYSGSDTELQRKATERGQQVFFSAGNGIENAFVVPNQTTFSSQEGPDWIVTVGAVEPGPDNYYGTSSPYGDNGRTTGSGRPADVAGVGSEYPTAYTSNTVGGTGSSGFGGTSNATPQIAGLYARGLYLARSAMSGPSRTQAGGVIARGAFTCGAARPGCELGDGALTNGELRARLFQGARRNGEGAPSEEELLATGHGFYAGREQKDRTVWTKEFERILAPLQGRTDVIPREPGELEWMIVDSYCRQQNWGSWTGGYYVEGQTELPASDPAWPIRSGRAEACPGGPVAP